MDESDRLAHYIMGLQGPPSFIRRELNAKGAWEALLARCRADRQQVLNGVRWNLQYTANRLKLRLDKEVDVGIRQVRKAVAGQSASALGAEACLQLKSLSESIDRFNAWWKAYVSKVDLSDVNREREKFNQNYVIEKECVVGSDDIARAGFEPMQPLTPDDVAKEFQSLDELKQFRKQRVWIVWPAYGFLSYLLFVTNVQSLAQQTGSLGHWIGLIPIVLASLALTGHVLFMIGYNRRLRSELTKLQSRSAAIAESDAEKPESTRRKSKIAFIMGSVLLLQLLLLMLPWPFSILLQMPILILLVVTDICLNHRGQQLIDEVFMMESMAAEMEATPPASTC